MKENDKKVTRNSDDILRELIANRDAVEELKNAIVAITKEFDRAITTISEVCETESYTDMALKTLNKDVFEQKDLILNASLGLSGEVGEVNDIIKKYMYHGHKLDNDTKEKIILELGDVCWYVALMAWAINKTKFEDILNKNLAKLDRRYHGEFSTKKSVNRKDVSDEKNVNRIWDTECEFELKEPLSDEVISKILNCSDEDVAVKESSAKNTNNDSDDWFNKNVKEYEENLKKKSINCTDDSNNTSDRNTKEYTLTWNEIIKLLCE